MRKISTDTTYRKVKFLLTCSFDARISSILGFFSKSRCPDICIASENFCNYGPWKIIFVDLDVDVLWLLLRRNMAPAKLYLASWWVDDDVQIPKNILSFI